MSVSEMKASLPIDRVTVFPQSALIQRRGKLPLSGGETRVALEGLPGGLTPDSVRVEVEPDQGLVILDVASSERLIDPMGDREYGKLKDQYDSLLDEKRKCAARLANCLSELSLFLEKESLTARAQSGTFLPVNVEGWKEFFAFLRERLTGNRTAYRERLFELLELEKRIAAASANLARRQAGKDREHEIALRVEAPRAGEYFLSVGYLQEDVFWYPVYAVAGSPEEKSCTVSLSAVVGQSSGEDWSGVELMLSTAVPMFSCSIPVLSSRRLREAAAEMELRRAAPAGEMMKSVQDDEALMEAEEAPAAAPAERMRAMDGMGADKKSRMRMRKERANSFKGQFASGPAPAPKAPAASASPVVAKSDVAYRPETAAPAPSGGADLRAVVDRFRSRSSADPAEAFRSNSNADALFQVAGSAAFRTPPELEAGRGGQPAGMDGPFRVPPESLGGYDYRYSVAGRRDIPSSPSFPARFPLRARLWPRSSSM